MTTTITNPKKHYVQAALNWLFDNATNVQILALVDPKVWACPMGYVTETQVPVNTFDPTTGSVITPTIARTANVIQLNISAAATNKYVQGENALSFQTRFSGVLFNFDIPYEYIVSVFCPEVHSLHQMFPVDITLVEKADDASSSGPNWTTRVNITADNPKTVQTRLAPVMAGDGEVVSTAASANATDAPSEPTRSRATLTRVK